LLLLGVEIVYTITTRALKGLTVNGASENLAGKAVIFTNTRSLMWTDVQKFIWAVLLLKRQLLALNTPKFSGHPFLSGIHHLYGKDNFTFNKIVHHRDVRR
jgi:hypothetical protein